MLEKYGKFVVKHRWWIIVIWFVVAMVIIGFGPKLSSVENSNQTSFLPNSYESVRAQNLAQKVFPATNDPTNLIVFSSTSGGPLTPTDTATIQHVTQELSAANLPYVSSVVTNPLQLSPDGKVQLTQVTYKGQAQDKAVIDSTQNLRTALANDVRGTTLAAGVTGGLAISYDTQDSFDNAIKIVSIATILLVLILPALVFRSPLTGLLPVLAVGLVYAVSSTLIAIAAKTFDFKVSQQLSILFTVVLFGAGTDYILFLLFRYRERLRAGGHSRESVGFALARASEAIFSAALVVISSFVALFFAKFGIFTSFAPGLVISVGVMLIAALTLVPALVAVLQEKIFWPTKPKNNKFDKPTVSKRLGQLVSKRPAWVAAAIFLLLIVLSVGALYYKADFSSISQAPARTPSATAFNKITAAFPAGVLSPTLVYASSNSKLTPSELQKLTTTLKGAKGVSSVFPPKLSTSGQDTVFSVILKDNPYSSAAISDVAGPIRTAAHSVNVNGEVLVGGGTSAIVDVKNATDRDLKVIFPIAALFIFVILGLLLRSIIAPIYLLISVSLGFAATLGATVLLFTKLGNSPGLIFFLPVLLYVFVVAIGTDYNILTVTRLREEVRQGNSPRRAVQLTIEHSSATVASAGIILAGTFISLTLARISLLTQMGVAIAVGVGLAAYIIAPLLIPSVSGLLGYAVWWPGHRPTKK